MELVSLLEEEENQPSLSPCEGTMIKWLSIKQEEGVDQSPYVILDFWSPELWEINVCFLSLPIYGILFYQLKQ